MQGLQEGHGGVGRAHHGGHASGEQAQTEQTVAQVAGGQTEGLSSGVAAVGSRVGDDLGVLSQPLSAAHAGAQHRQEQQDTYHTGGAAALQDALAHVADVLGAGDAGVQQTVGTGEGDVAAAGAAQQGGQRGEHAAVRVQQLVKAAQALGHLTQRGLGDDGHHQHGDEDDGGQDGGHLVHDGLGVLVDEDDNTKAASHNSADLLVQADHGVEAQSYAAHVAYVKGQATDGNQDGDDDAQTRQQLVGHILSAHLGDGDHGPDIHLGGDIHDDGQHDDQGQSRTVLCGKGGRLSQEAGADGRGGHQEGGAEQNRPTGFCGGSVGLITHNIDLLNRFGSLLSYAKRITQYPQWERWSRPQPPAWRECFSQTPPQRGCHRGRRWSGRRWRPPRR